MMLNSIFMKIFVFREKILRKKQSTNMKNFFLKKDQKSKLSLSIGMLFIWTNNKYNRKSILQIKIIFQLQTKIF